MGADTGGTGGTRAPPPPPAQKSEGDVPPEIAILTDIIKEPTKITCSTFRLLDHIPTNSSERFSQKGAIDVGISIIINILYI